MVPSTRSRHMSRNWMDPTLVVPAADPLGGRRSFALTQIELSISDPAGMLHASWLPVRPSRRALSCDREAQTLPPCASPVASASTRE